MESKAQMSMIGDAKGELMWHEREVGPFHSRAEQENGEKWFSQNAIETLYVIH